MKTEKKHPVSKSGENLSRNCKNLSRNRVILARNRTILDRNCVILDRNCVILARNRTILARNRVILSRNCTILARNRTILARNLPFANVYFRLKQAIRRAIRKTEPRTGSKEQLFKTDGFRRFYFGDEERRGYHHEHGDG
jgi:hypothetical protein